LRYHCYNIPIISLSLVMIIVIKRILKCYELTTNLFKSSFKAIQKVCGELEVKNIKIFNEALLEKWRWFIWNEIHLYGVRYLFLSMVTRGISLVLKGTLNLHFSGSIQERCRMKINKWCRISKLKVRNVYGNEWKTWVIGSFHSSFKEELLDEFLDKGDLQKFAENLENN